MKTIHNIEAFIWVMITVVWLIDAAIQKSKMSLLIAFVSFIIFNLIIIKYKTPKDENN